VSNRRGALPRQAAVHPPYALDKGAELGRFELGSTVILLTRPDEATLDEPAPGTVLRMGQAVGRMTGD